MSSAVPAATPAAADARNSRRDRSSDTFDSADARGMIGFTRSGGRCQLAGREGWPYVPTVNPAVDVSLVVPAHDERESLPILIAEIGRALGAPAGGGDRGGRGGGGGG